ncbi:MAG TPA: YtxH domain-containing protein [Thermomicrobiales bacterium]|jgi:gas vesicle protein
MMVRQRHNVAFMMGILLGACAAACATLLFTPLSGRETRAQFQARYAELRGDDAGAGPVTRL